jgi:hypothetical protein
MPSTDPLDAPHYSLAANPFRIRTSNTQDLKPFRINTYKKPRGGGVLPDRITSSTRPPFNFARGDKPPIQPSLRNTGRRHWTPREITGTLLVTRRVSPRRNPPPPVLPAGSR